MKARRRVVLWTAAVLVAGFSRPTGAQGQNSPPGASATSSGIPARRLLTLTFEGNLKSEQKSVCSFLRPSRATTFDSQGFLIEVAANVPRYRTIDGNTGVLVEGPRTNYCANSSFEAGLTGWSTGSLKTARNSLARLH